ncbi:MAG: PQQ-binding-like beta-propeller repeat protein [Deltaproteobacteria bacterium]|nr:PQQ-binding-like beta-propeller repeat protein [Deltaproteobacteria bacterium]
MQKRLWSVVFVVASLMAIYPVAADWPQWRGPSLDGSSSETGLPVEWSADKNVTWKLALPARGAATPIVWGDRIFLSVSEDPEKTDRLSLWCLDRNTGKRLWERPLGGGNELKYKHHMASPSPVTDGQGVYVITGLGIVKGFDFAGEELWSRDLQKEYGKFGTNWGYASSPLLFDGSLFIQVLHGSHTDDPSYLLRVDPATGKNQWRVERPTKAIRESPDSYTTPTVLPPSRGESAQIVISGGDVVTGHDPATGRELWRAGNINPANSPAGRVVASPLVVGDLVYAFGKRGPIVALQTRPEDNKADPKKKAAQKKESPAAKSPQPSLAWSREKGTDVPTPVSDGKYLYVITDKGLAWCLDAKTGEALYGPQRLAVGTYSGSPVIADGRIYITSELGMTTVLRTGAKFEVLSENDLDGYTLASPAISEGQIFIRTADFLFAIGQRRSSG